MTPLPAPRSYSCRTASGVVYDHGAHVVDWTPQGQEPVLWMSAMTKLESGSPIRGGIPICWPWFGAGVSGTSTPLHGFARLTNWQLAGTVQSDDAVTATYALDAESAGLGQPCQVIYEVGFGTKLGATLTVRNTGQSSLTFEEALHTYLRVGDVRTIRLVGLDGSAYHDRAAGQAPGPHRQTGDLTITAETDRIYDTTGAIEVVDPTLRRRLTLDRTGSADAVVWNPWIAKSAAMPDFGDDEWTSMLCVETCNVGAHAITVEPGEEHTMGFTLAVSAV